MRILDYETARYDYLSLCAIFGNPSDCPAKGGNVSVKIDNEWMIIKESGTKVRDASYAIISDSQTSEYWETYGVRASMEYHSHKVLASRYVAHYHPFYLMPWLCADLDFDFHTPYDIIEYIKPGKTLADKVSKTTKNIILLKNHGVIIHSNSVADLVKHYSSIKKYAISKISTLYLTPDDVVVDNVEQYMHTHASFNLISSFGLTPNLLTDDQVDELRNDVDEKIRSRK